MDRLNEAVDADYQSRYNSRRLSNNYNADWTSASGSWKSYTGINVDDGNLGQRNHRSPQASSLDPAGIDSRKDFFEPRETLAIAAGNPRALFTFDEVLDPTICASSALAHIPENAPGHPRLERYENTSIYEQCFIDPVESSFLAAETLQGMTDPHFRSLNREHLTQAPQDCSGTHPEYHHQPSMGISLQSSNDLELQPHAVLEDLSEPYIHRAGAYTSVVHPAERREEAIINRGPSTFGSVLYNVESSFFGGAFEPVDDFSFSLQRNNDNRISQDAFLDSFDGNLTSWHNVSTVTLQGSQPQLQPLDLYGESSEDFLLDQDEHRLGDRLEPDLSAVLLGIPRDINDAGGSTRTPGAFQAAEGSRRVLTGQQPEDNLASYRIAARASPFRSDSSGTLQKVSSLRSSITIPLEYQVVSDRVESSPSPTAWRSGDVGHQASTSLGIDTAILNRGEQRVRTVLPLLPPPPGFCHSRIVMAQPLQETSEEVDKAWKDASEAERDKETRLAEALSGLIPPEVSKLATNKKRRSDTKENPAEYTLDREEQEGNPDAAVQPDMTAQLGVEKTKELEVSRKKRGKLSEQQKITTAIIRRKGACLRCGIYHEKEWHLDIILADRS